MRVVIVIFTKCYINNPSKMIARDFVPTKSSLLKSNPVSDFKVTVFESYKRKKKNDADNLESDDDLESSSKTNCERKEINMKRARFEVLKFGMSGLDPKQKEEAKVTLAITLGAKPPKNKYKNYKELQLEKKQSSLDEDTQNSLQQAGKNSIGASNAKGKSYYRKRRKERGGLLDVYGTVKPIKGRKRRQGLRK